MPVLGNIFLPGFSSLFCRTLPYPNESQTSATPIGLSKICHVTPPENLHRYPTYLAILEGDRYMFQGQSFFGEIHSSKFKEVYHFFLGLKKKYYTHQIGAQKLHSGGLPCFFFSSWGLATAYMTARDGPLAEGHRYHVDLWLWRCHSSHSRGKIGRHGRGGAHGIFFLDTCRLYLGQAVGCPGKNVVYIGYSSRGECTTYFYLVFFGPFGVTYILYVTYCIQVK